MDLTGGRVLLLCYPRLLGYSFDPASVYFCYRADGDLALLIYEVCNTLGAIHPYVLPVTSPRRGLQYRLQYRLGDREIQRLYFARCPPMPKTEAGSIGHAKSG